MVVAMRCGILFCGLWIFDIIVGFQIVLVETVG